MFFDVLNVAARFFVPNDLLWHGRCRLRIVPL